MLCIINSLLAVEDVLSNHNNVKVEAAALRLQLALLSTAVEQVRHKLPKKPCQLVHGLDKPEIEALSRSQKIKAIKLYRTRTNVGLKEAKDAVDAYMQWKYGYVSFPLPYDI
jgi:ribosomal protein L7/L12